jgi:hypothetical protein
LLPGLFYFGSRPCCALHRPPCDQLANGKRRTRERSDGGPEGPKANGLSNVGHRQAPNTKTPASSMLGFFIAWSSANPKIMTPRTVTTCNRGYTFVKELAKTTSKI